MGNVKATAYLSPTLVLLAFDWDKGATRSDFLGFAVRRTLDGKKNWLPNRINFDGPHPTGGDYDSDKAPIQKFQWWDARIDEDDRGKSIMYEVFPVVGSAANPNVPEVLRQKTRVEVEDTAERKSQYLGTENPAEAKSRQRDQRAGPATYAALTDL